ncbi:MAG TPA: cytochrome c [Anaerolineaceae bacterium]
MRKPHLFSSNSSSSPRRVMPRALIYLLGLACVLLVAGCSDMIDQARYDPLSPSPLWADGRSARPVPTGVVQVGQAVAGNPELSGQGADGKAVTSIPIPVTLDLLQRGQQQYDIYCTPCHGYAGQGNGVATQFGMPAPPSFHTQVIYNLPDGTLFDVITNGYGRMFPYAYRIQPDDRWAIIAYVRALQLSQNANPQILTPAERQKLEALP